MDPLSCLASTIAIYQLASKVTVACFRYAEGVKRADSEVDATIDEIDKFKTSLRDLSALLQDERLHGKTGEERLQSLKKTMSENGVWLKACNDDLTKLQIKLEEQEPQAGVKGQAKQLLNKLKWPLKQEDVKRLLDNMRHVREQIEWAQNIDNLTMTRTLDTRTRRIEAMTKNVEATAKETNTNVKELGEHIRESEDMRRTKEEQKENEGIIKAFTEWLAHADPMENHNLACDARNKDANTGLWFLEGQKYIQFKTSHPSLLWLHGDPGCGKTILAASAIENLKASLEADSRLALAFWYFNANDKAKKSLEQCLRALLTQLARAFKNKVPSAIKSLWTNKGKLQVTPRLNDLTTTLTKVLSEENMNFYLVLDALDEAQSEDLDELLKLVHTLLNTDGSEIRIMVTSRLRVKNQFQERFESALFFDISIEREFVDQDIKAHIDEKLKSDGRLNRWKPDVRDLISEKLLNGAEGMFRWVDCQLDAIRRCNTQSAVKRTLNSLPKNLQEQYRRELEKISSADDAQTVVTILRWLAFPRRKITLEEAREIVAIEFDGDGANFDEEKKLVDSNVIFELCGSLVRIDENKEGTNYLGEHVEGVQSLTTSHNTVLDFLSSEKIKVGPLEAERFSRATVNYKMAISCLTYLQWLFLNVPTLSEDTLSDYPCARLSAEYFDDYIRDVIADQQESLNIEELNEMVIDIMDNETSLLKLVQLCNPDNVANRVDFGLQAEQLSSPMYYAALLGLPDIVEHYIKIGGDKNFSRSFGYGTPLVAAAAEGRKRCVEILLAEGADPNLSGWYYWGVPLAAAVEQNHTDVIKMLLERENVDVNGIRHKFPSQTSETKEDNSEVAQQQDGTAPEVNDSPEDEVKVEEPRVYEDDNPTIEEVASEPMLYIAANYNSPEAMDILLARGANVNGTGGAYHTALQAAAVCGQEALVNKLLDCKASSAIHGGRFDNALLGACQQYSPFSKTTYARLIDAGANINHKGGYNKIVTAVHCAACGMEPEILELLIERGGEVNVRGVGSWDNPLQGACANGNLENVRVLLKHGADTSFQGAGQVDNCLMGAATSGHDHVVKILLEAKVSPDVKGGELWYPLLAACNNILLLDRNQDYVGYVETIRHLLDAGADPNLMIDDGDSKGLCALNVMANRAFDRQLEVVKMLVEHGADVNTPEIGIFVGALGQAMISGKPETVRYLIEKGANVRAPGICGYLLGYGIAQGLSDDVVKTVAEYSDLDAVDDFNRGSALHAAARKSNFEILDMLLEAGASPDVIHWDIGSVLSAAVLADSNEEMVNKLCARVADNEATNMIGQNALLYACKMKASSIAQKLVSLGYYMIFTDKKGANGLHYAATHSLLDLVTLAIESGVDVNSTDSGLWTPLHYAAASTSPSAPVIKVLLASGADPELRDKQGLTAAALAFGFNKAIEFELLRGKTVPENLLFNGYHGLSRSGGWDDGYCDGCGDRRGPINACSTCPSTARYVFCFHCHLEHANIHPKDHEWTFTDFPLIPLPETMKYPEPDGSMPSKIIAEHLEDDQSFKFEGYTCSFGNDDASSKVVHARGDIPFSSRTPYFELTLKSCADLEDGIKTSELLVVGIGLAIESVAATQGGFPGWEPGSWGYHSDDGKLFSGPSWDEYGEVWGIGDTVGCGIDKFMTEHDEDLMALFFTKNGKHLGAFLVLTRERFVPVVTTRNQGVVLDLNFGDRDFVWQGDRYGTEPEKGEGS